MNSLEKYYGKKLVYVVTELKNGVINTTTETQQVYNPKDFKNCSIAPVNGCDLVIGHNSVNSENIYDIGGIMQANLWNDKYYCITVFNYCEPEPAQNVITEHKKQIKKALNSYIADKTEKINKVNSILQNL